MKVAKDKQTVEEAQDMLNRNIELRSLLKKREEELIKADEARKKAE